MYNEAIWTLWKKSCGRIIGIHDVTGPSALIPAMIILETDAGRLVIGVGGADVRHAAKVVPVLEGGRPLFHFETSTNSSMLVAVDLETSSSV
jgi:hypothetical protein